MILEQADTGLLFMSAYLLNGYLYLGDNIGTDIVIFGTTYLLFQKVFIA